MARKKLKKDRLSSGFEPQDLSHRKSGFKAPSVNNSIRPALYMLCSLWYAHDIEWLPFDSYLISPHSL